MKKIISVFLALATLAALAGCASQPAPKEENHDPDDIVCQLTAEPEPTVETASVTTETAEGETAVYEHGYISITMTVPEGWEYELIEDEGADPGIRFRPEGSGQTGSARLTYGFVGVCGTGLEEKEADFPGGEKAKIGYYDGNSDWSFVFFYDAPGYYDAWNEGLTGEKAEEALEIIGSAVLGKDAISRDEAEAIAGEGITYDYAYHNFDAETGRWTIEFRKEGESEKFLTVTLEADGTVVSKEEL